MWQGGGSLASTLIKCFLQSVALSPLLSVQTKNRLRKFSEGSLVQPWTAPTWPLLGLCAGLQLPHGWVISLTKHEEALCLLLGVKWQPLSGKALGPSCLLNKWTSTCHRNYRWLQWLQVTNHSCSILLIILPFPIREILPGFPSCFIQTTHLCSWNLGFWLLPRILLYSMGQAEPGGELLVPKLGSSVPICPEWELCTLR